MEIVNGVTISEESWNAYFGRGNDRVVSFTSASLYLNHMISRAQGREAAKCVFIEWLRKADSKDVWAGKYHSESAGVFIVDDEDLRVLRRVCNPHIMS